MSITTGQLHKKSELANKFISENRLRVQEKKKQQKFELQREKTLLINKISDIDNKEIEIKKELDGIGFALFGTKADDKRKLKKVLDELHKDRKQNEEKLKSLPSELKEVSGLVKTDCIYRQRYETGETITDLTEVYVMCEKEKSIYSVFTKKDNLLISDMRMDFNIVTGNLERKFYGVIDYLDDWNSDELVLVVNILKEEI